MKIRKKLTLTFDMDDWKSARGVINCFQSSVCESCKEGSVRRRKADKLIADLHQQARKQVGDDYIK